QQLRRQVAQLQEAEQRFRLAVEASPNAMVMVDEQERVVLVNAEAERVFGYARTELIEQPLEKFLPGGFREIRSARVGQTVAGTDMREMVSRSDLFGLRKDGARFPVEIGLNPIATSEGRFILSAIVDITDRRRVLQE